MTASDYKTFLCEYPFNGSTWCFTVMARSHAESEARLKQMPWASVKGEQMLRIPVGSESFWRRMYAAFGVPFRSP